MSAARREIDRADLLLGVIALAGAAGYLYQASLIPESLLSDPVGARGLPVAIGWVMAGLGLILCLRSVLSRPRTGSDAAFSLHAESTSGAVRRHLAALGLLAILAVYVVVLPYAGYVVATALLIGAVACFAGAALGRSLLLVAVVGAAVLWLLFDPLLGISLPVGSWWQGR